MKLMLGLIAVFAVGCEPSMPAAAAAAAAPIVQASPVKAPPVTDNPSRVYQLRDLATVNLRANGHTIKAWVMDRASKRQEGMMFLTDREVRDTEGMLFVFPKPQPLGFWMENTLIPLDLIFIDANFRVINIQRGKPLDQTNLPAIRPGKYVLELKQGGAKRFGIASGTKVEIPANVVAFD